MRILIVSGYGYWGDFTPDDLVKGERQVGGGETAMVNVARELAALGHEVLVFYDVKVPGRYAQVDYLPTNTFVPMICNLEHDVLVSWDNPHVFRFADKAKQRALAFQLNDAQVGVYDWAIDHYLHPSRWHMNRFHELYPEMTWEKMRANMTNGVDYRRFLLDPLPERQAQRVVYSSSPDRGLHHLLRIWPAVIQAIPKAELHVFYDMDKWLNTIRQLDSQGIKTNTTERAHLLLDLKAEARQVVFHGGVGQKQLAIEQLKSSIMAYPCDPVNPTEGFSMSILEGIASGCNVLTTDADALPELWGNAPGVTILPLPIDDQIWTDALIDKLRNGGATAPRVREDLSWANIARKWVDLFNGESDNS